MSIAPPLAVTLGGGLRAAAGRAPQKVAIHCEGAALRYGELAARIGRVARAAAAMGLPPGAHVVWMAPNCLEYVEVVAGFAEAGFAVVTASPHLTAPELADILEDSEARAIVVHPACEEVARSAADGIAPGRLLVVGASYERWRDAAHEGVALPAVPEAATFAISYTSGTTGRPKGVMLSHRSRVLTFLAMAAEYGCYGPDDRAVAVAPLYHGGGFAFGVAPLFFGGACTVLPRFEPETLLRTLAACDATNVFVVPTHVAAVFALPAAVRDAHRFPALRTIISNAAPLAQSAKEEIVAHFGEGLLFECYGSTEAGIVSNLRPADQLRKVQCVGQPFPCTEIAVLDDAGKPVAPGQAGEVYSRSPYLYNGYWRRAEETAASRRGEWVSAGDLGHLDEDGYLYIQGRSKDMILSGGINLYPREIEEVVTRHPGIREAVVVGVPDPHWGERVVAFVVAPEGLDRDAIERHCRDQLAGFKVPKEFHTVESVPRNPAGKLLRRVLREEWVARERGDVQ